MPELTHERLLQVLSYDRETGIFQWLVRPSNRIHIGDRAGVRIATGHRFINVDGEKMQASRLAWFYVNGEWPNGDIKFKDDNRDNVAIDNLVEMSRVTAARLRSALSSNTSGFKGVSRSGKGDKWQASITWNYKQVNLGGRFETTEDAAEVYNEAEKRLRTATNVEDGNIILHQVILWRKQRAAWRNIQRQNIGIGWASFDEFCLEVVDFPPNRFAIGPVDAVQPIGPGNWKWSTDHGISSVTDRVAYNRAKRMDNQNFMRGKDFRKKYGIDFAEYQRKLVEQGGVCACCAREEVKHRGGNIQILAVDHHHGTGAVRGLLCSNCNVGIGYLGDDPALLRKAADYLDKYNGGALPPDNTDT